MKINTINIKHSLLNTWFGMLLGLAVFLPTPAYTADLTFAQSPLFLAGKVQPNILFTVDDSGSMDWEVLMSEGALAVHGSGSNEDDLDFTPNNDTELLELCVGYNTLAYDPNKTYSPWAGKDEDALDYTDKTLTTALNNPYDNDNIDLLNPAGSDSDHFYMIWADNGDGVYQNGECPLPGFGYGGTFNSSTECAALTGCVNVTSLSATLQTNYANWYTYYRKREYVAKKAVSSLIDVSTDRVGLSTLWNHNTVRTLIKDVDDLTTPIDPIAQANKSALMNNLFRISSSNGTPLRSSLQDTGEYFLDGGSWAASSPILSEADGGACQQNFTILMTDGYANSEYSTITANNADANTSSPWDGGSYADTFSDTLADVAMFYYKTDLSSLDNLVPVTKDVDENDAQHLVTFTVAFGVNGTLSSNPSSTTLPFTWPQPVEGTPTSIDDMRHAAWNSRGLFLNAGDPQMLIDSLTAAISSIGSRGASAAAVSVNTGSITSDSFIFQARFDSEDWTGEVRAIPINANGTLDFDNERNAGIVPNTPLSRVIVTWDGSTGQPFRLLSDLSTAQSTLLDDDQNLLDYLRGDQSNEESNGGTFRNRSSLLGDVINASPSYVGAPDFAYDNDDNPGYDAFADSNDSRTPVLYVASNDGMLHAFKVDPDSTGDYGNEIFAYIPGEVYGKLKNLSNPKYTHQYTVDGSPNIVDAYFSGSWHSVLIAGLNSGGQGIYTLDVTDPGDFTSEATAKNKVLWEFTDQDDSDLGYTFSQPNIVKLQNGVWAAIFGNGYNSTEPDGTAGGGTPVLYIVDLATGALIKKMDTGKNDLSTPNGMSNVSPIDVNGDNKVDYVYGGDLEGNLWKFDLTAGVVSDWKIVDNKPMFTACSGPCSTLNRQPITVSPIVGRHPKDQGFLVSFGTGTYLLAADNSASGLQTFYTIWDQNRDSSTYPGPNTMPTIDRTTLLQQKIIYEENVTFGTDNFDLRITTDENDDPIYKIDWKSVDGSTGDHYGWYMDLVNTEGGNTDGRGERQVSDPILRNGRIIFTTLIPSNVVCDAGGEGWLMELDANDGSRLGFSPFDLNGDDAFDQGDYVTVIINGTPVSVPVSGKKSKHGIIAAPGIVADGDKEFKYNSTSSGDVEVTVENPGGGEGERVSWQQL